MHPGLTRTRTNIWLVARFSLQLAIPFIATLWQAIGILTPSELWCVVSSIRSRLVLRVAVLGGRGRVMKPPRGLRPPIVGRILTHRLAIRALRPEAPTRFNRGPII